MPSEEDPPAAPPAVPIPDPKSTSVRSDVLKSDKVAWVTAAKLQGKTLEQWATDELNAAAEREKNET